MINNNYVDFLNEYRKNKRFEKWYGELGIIITKDYIGMLSDDEVSIGSMYYLHNEIEEILYCINKEYELDNTVFDDFVVLDIYEKLYRVKFQLDGKLIEFRDIANQTDRDLNWFDLIIYFDWYKPLDKKYITVAKILGTVGASLLLMGINSDKYKYSIIAKSGGLLFTIDVSIGSKQVYISKLLMKYTKSSEVFWECNMVDEQIEVLTKGRELYENLFDYLNNNREYIAKVLGE